MSIRLEKERLLLTQRMNPFDVKNLFSVIQRDIDVGGMVGDGGGQFHAAFGNIEKPGRFVVDFCHHFDIDSFVNAPFILRLRNAGWILDVPMAGPGFFAGGLFSRFFRNPKPQCGHINALSDTLPLHSLQCVNAMGVLLLNLRPFVCLKKMFPSAVFINFGCGFLILRSPDSGRISVLGQEPGR